MVILALAALISAPYAIIALIVYLMLTSAAKAIEAFNLMGQPGATPQVHKPRHFRTRWNALGGTARAGR